MNAGWLTALSVVGGVAGTVVGDLAREEVRRRLDALPMLLVRLASRRLPEPARADRVGEWEAELGAILLRRGLDKFPISRLVVGVRFALGLFVAAPAFRPRSRRAPVTRLATRAVALAAVALMLTSGAAWVNPETVRPGKIEVVSDLGGPRLEAPLVLHRSLD